MRPLRAVRNRVSGGFRQIGRLRVPLQKREQAPALHTLARAPSPSAACRAKRLELIAGPPLRTKSGLDAAPCDRYKRPR